MSALTQEAILKILWIDGLTPWTQDSFFLFSGSLLATSWNNGWVDIHEIVRKWTKGAIGYTVSRLNRLFPALQTSLCGGLRSRNASCFENFGKYVQYFSKPGDTFLSGRRLVLPRLASPGFALPCLVMSCLVLPGFECDAFSSNIKNGIHKVGLF